MAVRYQLVMNCADPEPLARFWAAALGYELEPPPAGFATWDDFRRSIGLPDSFLGVGTDSIIDPDGAGPRIWFQVVPDAKTITNRLHLDIHASGDRSLPLAVRRQRVDAEAQRLAELGATWVDGAPDDVAADDSAPEEDGLDHYAVAMKDPEGNEFDIN